MTASLSDGPSFAQLEFAADTTPKKVRLKLMMGLSDYDEFSTLIEEAINFSISEMAAAKNIINPAAKNKSPLDEDQLTLVLSGPLKGMGFDITHSTNVGGNCDVVVRGSFETVWLGEAKIYSDYGKLMGGFQQLCDRYCTGLKGQTRGAMLIYFLQRDVADVMEKWRAYLEDARPNLKTEDEPTNVLQFRSQEPHEATKATLHVLHMPIPLLHEPTDVAPPPRRKVA